MPTDSGSGNPDTEMDLGLLEILEFPFLHFDMEVKAYFR